MWATFGPLSSSTNSLYFDRLPKLRQTSFTEMHTYFSFGLILRDIPNSVTPQTLSGWYWPRSDILYSLLTTSACGPPLTPSPFFPVPERGTSTCARDRHEQQLTLNVHVKHSDLTWPDLTWPDLTWVQGEVWNDYMGFGRCPLNSVQARLC